MKTENQRKLKGSVLLTVVSVLSIMIIFMTCALAMAAAANKRSRKTYSSSQSSYTARTAIDSILAAIGYYMASVVPYDQLDAKVAEYSNEVKIVMIALGIFVVAYLAYKGLKK